MPVDRAQFEAAAQQVIKTAPPGLSREAFYDLVAQELAKPLPAEASAGMLPQSTAQDRTRGSRAQGLLEGMQRTGASLRDEALAHPLRTAAALAVPYGLGKVARFAPAAGRFIGEALQNPLTGAAIGAVPGALRGDTSQALTGGLVGAAGGGAVGKGLTRLFTPRAPTPPVPYPQVTSRYIPSTPTPRGPSAPPPGRAGPGRSTGSAGPARGPRPPTEGVEVERLFQRLARKPILSPAEQAQFEQLQQVVGGRAREVGLGYASGGRRGLPKP